MRNQSRARFNIFLCLGASPFTISASPVVMASAVSARIYSSTWAVETPDTFCDSIQSIVHSAMIGFMYS
jgi:hypothetical protein